MLDGLEGVVVLDEVWRTKDQQAAEAGSDVVRFFTQLREWAAGHPHDGALVRSAEELRELVEGRQLAAIAPREKAPER